MQTFYQVPITCLLLPSHKPPPHRQITSAPSHNVSPSPVSLPHLIPQDPSRKANQPPPSLNNSDLVMCRKQPGIAIGRLCDKCDGKCPVCDSYVRPTTLVRICDECSFGNYQNKCVVCGGEVSLPRPPPPLLIWENTVCIETDVGNQGISDAFYCFECTRLEKDRDGCPKIINLGSSRTDLFYQKKNFRNH